MMPLRELMAMSVPERLEAVAIDLWATPKRYSSVDPHDLADALAVSSHWKPDGSWAFVRYAKIERVEKSAQRMSPASELIHLLQGKVSAKRFKSLLAKSARLDDDEAPTFDFLTAGERHDLEQELAKKQLANNEENGMNCLAHFSVTSVSGTVLRFEAEVEDDGECLTLRTPYDQLEGGFVELDGCITDSW